MLSDKFDRALLARVGELLQQPEALTDKTLREIGEREEFPVLITHRDPPTLPQRRLKERRTFLDALKKQHGEKQGKLLHLLESMDVKPVNNLLLSNSVVARMTLAQLQKLGEQQEILDEVDLIRLVKEERVTCLYQSVQVIEARPYVWDVLNRTGQGIKVAILDTGIDKNHPALAGKVVDEVSTVPNEGVAVPGSHGTHCAGIVASQDPYRRGVAPGADLINVKVLTAWGSGQPDWVENGMAEAYRLGADVVSLSLGWSHIYHGWQCDDGRCPLCRAAKTLVDLGVVVVVAAGNENDQAAQLTPAVDTSLRCPGQCREVITVGAVDNVKELAGFSSVGPPSYYAGWTVNFHFWFCLNFHIPTPGEPWWTKPDLCAPGVNISSAVLNNQWGTMSGTSMAAPHVAGVAALVLQQHAGFPPQSVKNTIKHTAESLKDKYSRFQAGDGIVNAYTAVLRA